MINFTKKFILLFAVISGMHLSPAMAQSNSDIRLNNVFNPIFKFNDDTQTLHVDLFVDACERATISAKLTWDGYSGFYVGTVAPDDPEAELFKAKTRLTITLSTDTCLGGTTKKRARFKITYLEYYGFYKNLNYSFANAVMFYGNLR